MQAERRPDVRGASCFVLVRWNGRRELRAGRTARDVRGRRLRAPDEDFDAIWRSSKWAFLSRPSAALRRHQAPTTARHQWRSEELRPERTLQSHLGDGFNGWYASVESPPIYSSKAGHFQIFCQICWSLGGKVGNSRTSSQEYTTLMWPHHHFGGSSPEGLLPGQAPRAGSSLFGSGRRSAVVSHVRQAGS